MIVPSALVRFFEPWSELYGNSAILPTLVVFGHVAALVFAGGQAITLDRATLRARDAAELRSRQLDDLARGHRVVLSGLALSVVTGVLLFTADIETYVGSWIYWTKMGLIALLLLNGFVMTRAEARIRSGPAEEGEPGWRTLRRSAAASIGLWFSIAFAGVALVNT